MKLQAVLFQPLRKDFKKSFGLAPILKHEHCIIRIADDRGLTLDFLRHDLFEPAVEHLVQIYV